MSQNYFEALVLLGSFKFFSVLFSSSFSSQKWQFWCLAPKFQLQKKIQEKIGTLQVSATNILEYEQNWYYLSISYQFYFVLLL